MNKFKRFTLALALLVAVALSLTALGESAPSVQLEKAYEVYDASFLGNTDLVAFANERNGLLGIMDPEGKTLVPNEYLSLKLRNAYGFIEAVKSTDINGTGLIDSSGSVLMPPQYGVVDVLNRHWAIGITLVAGTSDNHEYKVIFGGDDNPYFKASEYTIYNMNTREAVGSLPRDQVDRVYGFPGFLLVKGSDGAITVYDEGFASLGTATEYYQGFVIEKKDEQYEVKRPGDGKLLFTTEYKVSDFLKDDEQFRIEAEGKQGRLDLEGNLVVPPVHEQLTQVAGAYYRGREAYDGKEGLLDLSGQVVVPFQYDEVLVTFVRGISIPGLVRVMVDGFAPVLLEGKVGFVNDQGEETVAPAYAKEAVKQFANTLLYSDISGKFVLVAADGVVTELPYKEVSPLYNANNGRYFFVKDAEGKSTVVDWHGQPLLPLGDYAEYDCATSNGGSFMLIRNKDTKMVEGYHVK